MGVTGHLCVCMTTYPDAATCLQAASAWSCWWAGFQISQYQFWGFSVLVWARIGKAVQFLSAAFILVEIVGFDRLENASESIANWPTPFRRGLLSIRRIGGWFWAFLRSLPKVGILLSVILMPIGLIVFALDYFGVFEICSGPECVLLATGELWAGRVLTVVLAVGVAVFIGLIVYSLLISAITCVVALIANFLSWLAAHPLLERGTKLTSWILFVVGFALDFVGS